MTNPDDNYKSLENGAIVFASLDALSIFMQHAFEVYGDDWNTPETLCENIEREWDW